MHILLISQVQVKTAKSDFYLYNVQWWSVKIGVISHQSECAKTEQLSIWGLSGFFAYFSVKRNVIKSQLWVYLFFLKVFPMIGNVTKVTLNFFLEKLDDIPCIIIFFLTHDRIVLIVALSHLSFPKRKFTHPKSIKPCNWGWKFLNFDYSRILMKIV